MRRQEAVKGEKGVQGAGWGALWVFHCPTLRTRDPDPHPLRATQNLPALGYPHRPNRPLP